AHLLKQHRDKSSADSGAEHSKQKGQPDAAENRKAKLFRVFSLEFFCQLPTSSMTVTVFHYAHLTFYVLLFRYTIQ
ncbi:hypothetical protein EVA_10450, partial [gut metagenome]